VTAAGPVLRHPVGALVEHAGESLVVFVPEPESLHLLDGPAALIWQLADGCTIDEVAAVLGAQFPAAVDLDRDVRATMAELTGLGVLCQAAERAGPE
jgi:hypothetical protein